MFVLIPVHHLIICLKQLFFILLLAAAALHTAAQCHLSVTGAVLRMGGKEKVMGATLLIKETGRYAVADSMGNFRLDSLCPSAASMLQWALHIAYFLQCKKLFKFLTQLSCN